MGHSDSARRKGPNQPPAPDLAIPSQQIASMEGILKLELGKKIWEGRTSKGGKKGRGGRGGVPLGETPAGRLSISKPTASQSASCWPAGLPRANGVGACVVMLARSLTSEDLGLHDICAPYGLGTRSWLCLLGPSSSASAYSRGTRSLVN